MVPSALWLCGCWGPPGVVAVAAFKAEGARPAAARKAFWSLPASFLRALADEEGIKDPPVDLLGLVKALVLCILGPMAEEDLYELLLQRSDLPLGRTCVGCLTPLF